MSLLPLEEALLRLLAQADSERVAETQWLPAAEAAGRVLAAPLIAGIDLPPWPNSAMDGYALRHADWTGEPLVVSQQIFAGQAPQPLEPGTCARIFTGAPVPEGCDTVEMQENTRIEADGRISFTQALKFGSNIRPQGQEVRVGEVMLEAGSRLGPVELALAASLGVTALEVCRPLKVALLSTGDELVEPGQPLAAGQIYNSNRPLLAHWLERLGCEVQDAGILPDDAQLTRDRLAALGAADLILSTGGVSAGDADCLGQVLREEGELTFWKLALKPGKPLTCGRWNGIPVIGLPGNPASSLVTFGLLARPYILRRMGVQRVEPLRLPVRTGFAWPKAGTRREFLRARIENGRAVLYPNQSPGVLRSASWADGLVELMEGQTYAEGDVLEFIPFDGLY